MSTDQTPALARATEALRKIGHDGEHGLYVTDMDSRVAVSAALHDPDDPDWLAKVIFDRRDGDDIREWDDASSYDQEWFQCAADAVRAAILGTDQ